SPRLRLPCLASPWCSFHKSSGLPRHTEKALHAGKRETLDAGFREEASGSISSSPAWDTHWESSSAGTWIRWRIRVQPRRPTVLGGFSLAKPIPPRPIPPRDPHHTAAPQRDGGPAPSCEGAGPPKAVRRSVLGQYSMTTRPSILPWTISSKISLMSSSGLFVNVGWIFPAA